MSEFEKRLQKGNLLQKEFITFLDENNISYILSGYEYLLHSNNAMSILKKSNDLTSLFIRHYPDLSLLFKNKSVLIEIKNSTGIEEEAYNNYFSLQNKPSSFIILLVFLYTQDSI